MTPSAHPSALSSPATPSTTSSRALLLRCRLHPRLLACSSPSFQPVTPPLFSPISSNTSSQKAAPNIPPPTSPPVRKRARLGKGKHILPPSESDLKGHLQFTKKKDQKRYQDICRRSIIPCKYIHHPTMEALNITTPVLELIANIGWQNYFSITCPAYIELVREFYTTFEFTKPVDFTLNSPRVVKFRLMGKDFKLSITEFNIAFGFITDEYAKSEEYLHSTCDFSESFEPVSLYRTLSISSHYDPSKSKDSYLRDPVLKYIHRFLAFTFSGRKDSSRVLSKAEFYFLWCMQNKIKVNLGCWLASQFAGVLSNRRPLILGSLITQLAVHENLIDLEHNNLHVACDMLPLDLDCLTGMGLIGKKKGVFYFYPPGPITLRQQRTTLDAEEDDVVQTSRAQPSTSTAPSSGRYDHQFERLELRIERMERNLTAFFDHMGFVPPSPPSM